MFWWGRVNSIIAIVAFEGSAIFLMSGKVGETIVLWILIILLRVALIVCNFLYTAIVGAPLFYDTRIQYEQQQERDRVVDDD